METGADEESRLNICMLLPLPYQPNLLIFSKIKMISYLTRLGHQVTWIMSSDSSPKPQEFCLDGVKVCVTPYRHFFPGASILAKSFNRIPHFFTRMRFILSLFRERQYDLIIAQPDIYDVLVAAYIKRRHKVPFVLDLPDPIETTGLQLRRFWHYLVIKSKEFAVRRFLHQADLILAISELLKDDLVNRKGISESKIVLVPEGVNTELFSPRDGMKAREEYRFHDSRVVIYEGTLSKYRQLDLLIEAFSKVRGERAGVKLLMVGHGDDEERLRVLAEELRIGDDVVFTGQVPQSEVPDFIATADIGISPVPPSTFYRFSSPTKMFEYMAMEKPVVANREIPEHEEVLEESGGGVLVPFSSDAFAEAIIRLLDDPRGAAEMGRMGRDWVTKNRSHEVMARNLEAKYLDLVHIKCT